MTLPWCISIIFQEPMTSLSPLHTVGNQVGEALHLHRDMNKAEARATSSADSAHYSSYSVFALFSVI